MGTSPESQAEPPVEKRQSYDIKFCYYNMKWFVMLTEQDFLHLSSKADDSCGIAHMRINHACHVRNAHGPIGIPGMLLRNSRNVTQCQQKWWQAQTFVQQWDVPIDKKVEIDRQLYCVFWPILLLILFCGIELSSKWNYGCFGGLYSGYNKGYTEFVYSPWCFALLFKKITLKFFTIFWFVKIDFRKKWQIFTCQLNFCQQFLIFRNISHGLFHLRMSNAASQKKVYKRQKVPL